jgi:hypothetical protein
MEKDKVVAELVKMILASIRYNAMAEAEFQNSTYARSVARITTH